MKRLQRSAARAAITLVFLGSAAASSLSAQRVQDTAPLPATAPATASTEQTTTPAREPAGPRIRPEIQRLEPVLGSRADAPAAARKDSMHTITISTVALVLLVVIIVLLVA